jgi:L-rhamnose mutarotase
MQRGAWIFQLKPGREAAYREAHAAVWPELIAAARQAGLRNHSVHVLGRTVVAYAEAQDLQATMQRLASDPVNLRWNESMAGLMEDVDGDLLEEVFHFE